MSNGRAQLIRGIGLLGAGLLVLNSVVGAGIFALPSSIATMAGTLSPWLFLVVGVLAITIVLSFAELSSYFRDSGGPVLYTHTAFGPAIGFGTGWMLYISRMYAFAANTNVIPEYLGAWWPWAGAGTGRAMIIVAVCAGLTIANYVGVREGVRTVGILTVLKLSPLVLMILLGLPYVTPETLLPRVVPHIDDFGGMTLLLIYAYVGFESVTIVSGETREPERTMPRALVRTLLVTAALYFLIVLVFISVLPAESREGANLVDVGRKLAGPAGAAMITFAAVFSVTGNLSAIMVAVPRLTFALSKEQLLPLWFSAIHARFATPANSIVFLGVLSTAFALSGSFAYLAVASSLTRLLSYMLSIAALPVIRRRATGKARHKAYRLIGGYTIPLVAFAVCAWIAAQSTAESWIFTGGLLLVGWLLFLLTRPR